jgi:hypothetical protein
MTHSAIDKIRSASMTFDHFLSDLPRLHSWDGGKTWVNGGFEAFHLKEMAKNIRRRFSKPRIIETGAGNSTLVFLFCEPENVVSICPDQPLFHRISAKVEAFGLDLTRSEQFCDFSQSVLPDLLKTDRKFDFALIDGAHGWPLVMVDFCYLNAMLPRGALLMLDDIQLHSVRELANLLFEQPGFELVADISKALIFEKLTDDIYLPEWNEQPYIVRRSNEATSSQNEIMNSKESGLLSYLRTKIGL